MNVLIIEDETRAANQLKRLLNQLAPDFNLLACPESVEEAVNYLSENSMPDLIFSDIELADGLSFEIYHQIEVSCPIIFTTAYNQYAIEAFHTSGIDYLLKPINPDQLKQAIAKARNYSRAFLMTKLINFEPKQQPAFKSRFMIKVGERIKSISVNHIRAFYSQNKASYVFTDESRTYCLDYSLDQLESLTDPELFFRINRKCLIHLDACSDIISWSNSRLRLKIPQFPEKEVIVARERVNDFKEWLGQ